MAENTHTISVVIPVYQAERTLEPVLAELERWHEPFTTPDGHRARVSEVLLVHDCGPDASDHLMRQVAAAHDWVRLVWLSRNFGQHAATLAGMSSSGGDWVATIDEDGQHDPADLAVMLDRAMAEQADVVYAAPMNPPPHGFLRNTASRLAKRSIRWFTGRPEAEIFHSYRLILGDVARSVAAYAGSGVYLDIALNWVSRRATTAPVRLRHEGDRPSGYSWRTLMSHYWRMVVTGGTRILRLVSLVGVLLAVLGFLVAVVVAVARIFGRIDVTGWSSTMVVLLISAGAILVAIGVVAEYVGVAVNMAMGKPLYLIVSDRADGPLKRPKSTSHTGP
ncbi:MAG: glycosyltransferase [Nocardioides sp.]|nr:glycosyltransferase [Nocardioides sp.]